jgi:hypothetical protein
MIDTHAHLYDKQFSKDLDAVIDTAIEAGVEQFLLPNIATNTIEPMFRVCGLYLNIYLTKYFSSPKKIRFSESLMAMTVPLNGLSSISMTTPSTQSFNPVNLGFAFAVSPVFML